MRRPDDLPSGASTAVTAALSVWRAARDADGRPPDGARIARVLAKLEDPSGSLVLVERDGQPAGMGLVEPFRESDGDGALRGGWQHVSMLFVDPHHRRRGIGTELVQRLVGDSTMTLSLWTRESNVAGQALYRRCGFEPTGEVSALVSGEQIRRWERAPARALADRLGRG